MPQTGDRDPGFWRGNMEARMIDAEESVAALWKFRQEADKRIAVMETKMVVFAALAAAIGAMLPGFVSAVIK